MSSYLDRILDTTRRRLNARVEARPLAVLEEQASAAGPPRDFSGAIRAPGISLIAEFKRRSPSAGVIREGAQAHTIAKQYQDGGARALSVLTEPEFFGGSLEDLTDARGACDLPVLRKDFVVDIYQVVEARAAGADAVLLIAAALEPTALQELVMAVDGWGMTALVEIHDEAELTPALSSGAKLVGINQRDLRTFEVDTTLAARLRRSIPGDVAVVAESGISDADQVRALEADRVDAVLVGEALMGSKNPGEAIADLLGRPPT